MSREGRDVFELTKTYAFLEDGGAAPLVATGEAFWKDLMSSNPQSRDAARVARGNGWLVANYRIAEDATSWEMHPSGDELLVMLSGQMGVVLEQGGKERVVELSAGSACIVPSGTWHRQVVRSPGNFLGATYGKGTQHRTR